jgi:TusA-related sulfurtransferase
MREVNSLGKRCPAPILDLAQALKDYPREMRFLLSADDPATSIDIAAWARMTGNQSEEQSAEIFLITRKSDDASKDEI